MTTSSQILYINHERLPLSPAFHDLMDFNQLRNLSSLLKIPFAEIPFLPRSNYRIVREVLDILEENKLEFLIHD